MSTDTPPRRGAPGRRARIALAVAAPAALAVVPATLQAAPVIAANAVCVRPVQAPNGKLSVPPFLVTGSGFGPGANVEVARGDGRKDFGQAGADGSLSLSPYVTDLLTGGDPESSPFTLQATDTGGFGGNPPALGPSNVLALRAAPLAFGARPTRAKPSARVTFEFSGFTPDVPIYAHYRYKGRVRANVRLGAASNPCGLLTVKRRQIPVRNPGLGTWSVQFDQVKRFSPRSVPRRNATITVFRTFRRR